MTPDGKPTPVPTDRSTMALSSPRPPQALYGPIPWDRVGNQGKALLGTRSYDGLFTWLKLLVTLCLSSAALAQTPIRLIQAGGGSCLNQPTTLTLEGLPTGATNVILTLGPWATPGSLQGPGPYQFTGTQAGTFQATLEYQDPASGPQLVQGLGPIHIAPAGQTLRTITGPAVACRGALVTYRIVPELLGVIRYEWSLPPGSTINGPDSLTTIEVLVGAQAGTLTARAITGCGPTPDVQKQVSFGTAAERRILLVSGQVPIGPADQEIQQHLINQGYQVQAVIDSAADRARASCGGLVYVSASIDPMRLPTDLRLAPQPIIVARPEAQASLGLTLGLIPGQDFGREPERNVRVVNNTHELGQGVGLGIRPVYQTPSEVLWGRPRPNAIVVAQASSQVGWGAVYGYERGARLRDINAPARRVGLFIDELPGRSLGAFGFRLLDRAACWALAQCAPTLTLTTQSPINRPYCPGDSLSVPFTSAGPFSAGTIPGTCPPPQTVDEPAGAPAGWSRFSEPSASGGSGLQSNPGARTLIGWSAPSDQAGRYQVEVQLPPSANSLSTAARYRLTGRGLARTLNLNQRLGTGSFVILGQVDLIGDGQDSLLLEGTGLDGLPVWADAVRWTCLTPTTLDANRFEAQLSDALEGFSSPTVIGIETNPAARRVRARIPDGLPPGAGYRVRVVATNPSVTGTLAPLALRIGLVPPGPTLLRGPRQVCQGARVVYTLDTTEAGERFLWTLTNGARLEGALPGDAPGQYVAGGRAIIVFDSARLVQISIVRISRCRQGAVTPLVITIDASSPLPLRPTLESILGDTLCPRAGLPLEVVGVRPPLGFRWQASQPGVLTSDTGRTNFINLTAAGQGGRLTVWVRGVNSCGPGPADTLSIVVDSAGARPRFTSLVALPASWCAGQQVISAEARSANRFTWLLPTGLSGASASSQIRVISTGGGLYRVRVVAEGLCGRSDTASIDINTSTYPLKAYLITEGPGNLRPADRWLMSRLRRQGFQVEPVAPTLSNLIDSIACGQLIVVSPYLTGQAPRDLDTLSVPLLAFGGGGGANYPALGWALPAVTGQQAGTEITLTAQAHPITAGLGTGNRPVYDPPPIVLAWAGLPTTTGWARLAHLPGTATLTTLFAREGSQRIPSRQVGFYADTAGIRRQTGISQRLLSRSVCYLTGKCPPELPEGVTLAVATDTLSFCAGQRTQLIVRLSGFFDSRNQVQVRLSGRGQTALPTTPLLTQITTDTGGPIPINLPDTLAPGLYEITVTTTSPVTPPARVWVRVFRLTAPTIRVDTACIGTPITLTLGNGNPLQEGIRYQLSLPGRGIIMDTTAGPSTTPITLTLAPGILRPPRDTARLTVSGLGCPPLSLPAPILLYQVGPQRPATLSDSVTVCRSGGGLIELSPPLTGIRRLTLIDLESGMSSPLADSALSPLDTLTLLRVRPLTSSRRLRAVLRVDGPCGPFLGDTLTLIDQSALANVNWLQGRLCQNGPAQVRLSGVTPGSRIRLFVGGAPRDSLTSGPSDTVLLSAGPTAQVGQPISVIAQLEGCALERSDAPFTLSPRRTLSLPDLGLSDTLCPIATLILPIQGQTPGDRLRFWQTGGQTLGQGTIGTDSSLALRVSPGLVRGQGTNLRLTLTDGLCQRDSLSAPLQSRFIPPLDTSATLTSDTACPGATRAQLTLSFSEPGVFYRIQIGTLIFDSLAGTGGPITFTVRAFPATPLPDADSTNLRIIAERSPCPPQILPARAAIVKLAPADTLTPVTAPPVCQGQPAIIRIARTTLRYRYQPFVNGQAIGPERSATTGPLDIPIPFSPNRPDSILIQIRLRGGSCQGIALREQVMVRWRPTSPQRVPLIGPTDVCINTPATYSARLFPGATLINPEWRWPESARPDGLAQGVSELRLRLIAYPGPADTLYLTGEDGCAPVRGKVALRRAPDCLDLIIPNVLTPGQSGPESLWDIQGLEAYPEFTLTVLDQWGGVVHRQEGTYTPWTGQGRGGQPLPVATYYYVLQLGRSLPARTGSITVLR